MKPLETILIWLAFLSTSVYGHVALKLATGNSDSYEYARALMIWKNPWGLSALVSWCASCVIWALLLTRDPVSSATGVSSLRYVLIILVAALVLDESINNRQWIGFGLVFAGVYIIKS